MERKPGESFTYGGEKMVTFLYNNKSTPPSRDKATHRCFICSFGSQGGTEFTSLCGDSSIYRGECGPGITGRNTRVFLTKKDFKNSTREQRSLISTNPNKFK